MTFGQRLEAAREATGLSRARLAALVDVSYAYIRQLETGERGVPRADLVQRIAEELNVAPGRLLEDAPPEVSSLRMAVMSLSGAPGGQPEDVPRVPRRKAKALTELASLALRLSDEDLETVLQFVRRLAPTTSSS